MPRLDEVEREYEQRIRVAQDNDEALELSIGLQQYRELYKSEETQDA
jgi:hypothetical protein